MLGLLISTTAWPAKPISIIVPFPPGATNDMLAKLLAGKMADACWWKTAPAQAAPSVRRRSRALPRTAPRC